MTLDPNALLLSLAVSSVGFVLFAYGRKQGRVPHMLAGAALCVYPYFVENLAISAGIAVALVGLLVLAVRLGA